MAQLAVDSNPAPSIDASSAAAAERHRPGFLRTFVRRNKAGTVAFIVFGAIVLMSFLGPLFSADTNPSDVRNVYATPSWDHPLGTDYMGKDVLYQIINGGRTILVVAAIAALMATAIAVILGALTAMIGGKFDTALLMLTDVVLTVPGIILLGVLAAFVRLDSPLLLSFILAITGWPTLLLAVRSQVLSLKEREYIEAARMLDLGTPRILFFEVLPNMASYIVINFVFGMTGAMLGQVVLYFLGLVAMSGTNWGLMIQQAQSQGALFFEDAFFYIMSPITMIVLVQLSLILIARSLEDVFNPRLREG